MEGAIAIVTRVYIEHVSDAYNGLTYREIFNTGPALATSYIFVFGPIVDFYLLDKIICLFVGQHCIVVSGPKRLVAKGVYVPVFISLTNIVFLPCGQHCFFVFGPRMFRFTGRW